MDRKAAVITNEFFECPEALSAYQHTKAEAVLQREAYPIPQQSASGQEKRRGTKPRPIRNDPLSVEAT
jgi:hypothetical protein